MECSENQDAPANEDTDKEKVEKEKPVDKISEKVSDSEHECLVKEESLPLFAANENIIEQCDLSSNPDFSISRSSDISKDNENVNESAINPPPEDIVDPVASSSTANSEKKEASPQKSSDQEPKKWYMDPETSDENEYSDVDFESFDFNEEDLMDEEDLMEEAEEEEEEIPQRTIHQGPIEVVELSSDSENFEEKLADQDAKCPESSAQASGSESEALVPVNLCLDDLVPPPPVVPVESPPAPLPAVDVHEFIPVISISDEENEENANEARGVPAAAEAKRESGIKHPIEEADAEAGNASAKRPKKDENEPDVQDEQ